MKICVHCLVKNEEKFLWFAVASVINHVDEVLLWDTGSTDGSVEIEKEIQKQFLDKVKLELYKNIDKHQFTLLRQKMLEETEADWILILDGDEVWWKESISSVVEEINRNKCDVIVSPFVSAVGDIFHYQEENAGRYNIDGRTGNQTIRAIRKEIKGLKLSKDYGEEGYIDSTGKFLQESSEIKRNFIDAPFLHLTHLTRSSKDGDVMQRDRKLKHELGLPFTKDFYYPEVFFRPRPHIVESPWKVMTPKFKSRAFFETPLKKLKRRFV